MFRCLLAPVYGSLAFFLDVCFMCNDISWGFMGWGFVPWGGCLSYIVRRHLLLGLIVDEFDLNVTSVAAFGASGSSLPFFNTKLSVRHGFVYMPILVYTFLM